MKYFVEYDNKNRVVVKGITVDSAEISTPYIEVSQNEFDKLEQYNNPIIRTSEGIDKEVQERIRTKYSETDEYKMLRLGILDNTNVGFVEYNAYVEECREWGRVEKLELGGI